MSHYPRSRWPRNFPQQQEIRFLKTPTTQNSQTDTNDEDKGGESRSIPAKITLSKKA